jgi:hypothetical protein
VCDDPAGAPVTSFEEFWPYYLSQHSRRATRGLHVAGLALAIASLPVALLAPRYSGLVPGFGYGLAWVAHAFFEHNRPATFRHPLWSLRGDFRMFRLICAGRMGEELRRLKIAS